MKTLKRLVRGFFSLFPGPTVGDFLKLQEDVLERARTDTPGYQLHRWSEWEHHLRRMERTIRNEAGIPTTEVLPRDLHLGRKSARHLAELRVYVACKVAKLSGNVEEEQIARLRAMNAYLERERETPGPRRTSMPLAA